MPAVRQRARADRARRRKHLHFEDGLQDNCFSYAAYMMATGKGYLHWSPRDAFRFGSRYGSLLVTILGPLAQPTISAAEIRMAVQTVARLTLMFPPA